MTDVTTSDDLARLEALYRANVQRVYGFAVNRVGHDDAADVVAEVFHAAALAARDGRLDAVTPPWLMAVARNKVTDHWRRAYRRKARAHLAEARGEDLVHFPDEWTQDPRRSQVIAALDQLSDRDRGLLVLHHVDGVPVAELAEATGTSVSAVESALARARRRFRAHYQPGEGSPP